MLERKVWAALVGTPVAVELWAFSTGRTNWTLSPHARWLLRCHTRSGRAVTTALVGAGATWLAHHWLTVPPVD